MMIVRVWLGVLTVGCSAAISAAQAEVRITSDKSELLPGESTVVTLSAAFPISEFAFCCIFTDLMSSTGSTGWSDFGISSRLRAPGSSAGTPTGMGIEGILAGQAYFPGGGLWPDVSNPIIFWQATYTAPSDVTMPFDLRLPTQTLRFETYISVEESTWRSHIDGLIEGETTIHVVPAPASLALVLVGGALVNRRRW